MKREVGAVNEFEVTGLTPSTTYYYVVTGTNGRFYSTESNEIEVTTLAPTLDYKSVKTLPHQKLEKLRSVRIGKLSKMLSVMR